MEPMKTLAMSGTIYEVIDAQARQDIEALNTAMTEAQKAIQGKADASAVPTTAGIVDLIYPVGSVYLSVNSADPAQLFGGTWEQISQGRMLMGAATQGSIQQNTANTGLFGTLDSNELNYKFEAGQLGGKYRHTLAAKESGIPAHGHGMAHTHTMAHTHPAGTDRAFVTNTSGAGIGEKQVASGTAFYAPQIAKGTDDNWWSTSSTGASSAANTGAASKTTTDNNTAAAAANPHNNMPPYMTVNIWQRTA